MYVVSALLSDSCMAVRQLLSVHSDNSSCLHCFQTSAATALLAACADILAASATLLLDAVDGRAQHTWKHKFCKDTTLH